MAYELHVFNIGQGLFTLLVDNGFCMLADCGTLEQNPAVSPEDVLQYAAEIIRCAGGLNAVTISHQDIDHWSFLERLMRELYPGYERGVWYKGEGTLKTAKMLDGNGHYHECSVNPLGCCHNVYFKESYEDGTPCRTACRQSAEVSYTGFLGRETLKCKYAIQYPLPALDTVFRFTFYSCLNSQPSSFTFEGIKIKIDACGLSYEECFAEADNYVQLAEEQVTLFFEMLKEQLGRKYWSYKRYVDRIKSIFAVLFQASDAGNIGNVPGYIDGAGVLPKGPDIYMGGGMCGQSYCELQTQMRFYGNLQTFDTGTFLNIGNGGVSARELALTELAEDAQNGSLNNIEIYRNATSLIVCYSLYGQPGKCIVFPGDSTVHAFNSFLELWRKTGFSSCKPEVMLAPHHGSGNTNIVWESAEDGAVVEAADQPVINFLGEADPACLVISSWHGKFGHPDASFVMRAGAVLTNKVGLHELGMTVGSGFETLSICDPIYSTETVTELLGRPEIVVEDGGLLFSGRPDGCKRLITPPDGCFADNWSVS